MDTSTVLALLLILGVGLLLGVVVGLLLARARVVHATAHRALPGEAEVLEQLDRLADQVLAMEHARATWQGQLAQQVDEVRHSTDSLRRETASLSTALRRPQVRGRWGEMHLRRAVELAGLVDRCDFTEQVRLEDGALRPDLVVHLPGDGSVVVDAKVPLDAFLDAVETDGDDRAAERSAHLQRHARQVRTHVEALAARRYWRALPGTPEFVVLFLPAESFLSAALEQDGTLLEDAAARHVVLATPSTLIALLRTVALGWREHALADQTRRVHELGRELHERLATVVGHVDALGRSLTAAVGHYNTAVGSLESRVLVTARRFRDLQVTDEELDRPRRVEAQARPLSPGEELRIADGPSSSPAGEPGAGADGVADGPARRARGA
jgi:DNA recombination protein RmuC